MLQMLIPVSMHTCRAQQGYDASAYGGAAQAVQYDAYGQPVVYDTAMQVGRNAQPARPPLCDVVKQHSAAASIDMLPQCQVHTCHRDGGCWYQAALRTVYLGANGR
jgi:hypothetical protein